MPGEEGVRIITITYLCTPSILLSAFPAIMVVKKIYTSIYFDIKIRHHIPYQESMSYMLARLRYFHSIVGLKHVDG